MQVHQYLLVCAIFCAQLFGDCVDNEDCSDKVYCTEALIEGFITTPTSVGHNNVSVIPDLTQLIFHSCREEIHLQFAHVCKYVVNSEDLSSLYRIPLLVCPISALIYISFYLLSYVE